MSEVHRYDVVVMLSEAGGRISYDPHGPEIVIAEHFDRVTAERDALQQRLTAADERADVLEGLLREVSAEARHPDYDWNLETQKAIDVVLNPAEGRGDE